MSGNPWLLFYFQKLGETTMLLWWELYVLYVATHLIYWNVKKEKEQKRTNQNAVIKYNVEWMSLLLKKKKKVYCNVYN